MTNPQIPQDIVHSRLAPLLGEDYSVFHELISDELHIDVYCWAPTEQRLSLIHISEPTRRTERSRMPSSA